MKEMKSLAIAAFVLAVSASACFAADAATQLADLSAEKAAQADGGLDLKPAVGHDGNHGGPGGWNGGGHNGGQPGGHPGGGHGGGHPGGFPPPPPPPPGGGHNGGGHNGGWNGGGHPGGFPPPPPPSGGGYHGDPCNRTYYGKGYNVTGSYDVTVSVYGNNITISIPQMSVQGYGHCWNGRLNYRTHDGTPIMGDVGRHGGNISLGNGGSVLNVNLYPN